MEKTVIVKQCEAYDREVIERIISDGMRILDYNPSGKVFVKPNVVIAYKTDLLGNNAYTHPALVGSCLTAVSKVKGVARIDLGENSAVGNSTRLCFKHAGYYDEIKAVQKQAGCPVNIFCMDEALRQPVFIGGVVHDNLRISRCMAVADTKVYLPKLKCHCVSNMTGTVKLNIGICSDDERAIRHDFMLNEKIVDLLSVGWPDFIVMDAIDVGVGNEAFPDKRKLGLILMGRNPIAVDLVAARLLGFGIHDIPYLKLAVERGYTPSSLDEVRIEGDLDSLDAIDEQAKRIMPYNDEYSRWQDIDKELKRLNSPIRFFWGSYKNGGQDKCLTGCVMGIKMFLALLEQYAGPEAFSRAYPVVIVIGKCPEKIDARGAEAFLIGSCAEADIVNAGKIIRIDKCFTTAADMILKMSHRLGMPSPMKDIDFALPLAKAALAASLKKTVNFRYLQDIGYFMTRHLTKRV